jgi:hypothetical protein
MRFTDKERAWIMTVVIDSGFDVDNFLTEAEFEKMCEKLRKW